MTSSVKEKENAIQMAMKRLSGYLAERKFEMYLTECISLEDTNEHEVIGVKELNMPLAKLDDLKAEVQDDLKELNLGSTEAPCIIYISAKLKSSEYERMKAVLKQYRDCFT